MDRTTSKIKRVGRLSYDYNNIIGDGRFAIIFSGLFRNSLPVAVKRIQRIPTRNISDRHDDQLELLRVTQHPNILQWFGFEEDEDFIFIATELCECTLEEYVRERYRGPKFYDEREMLHQLTEGVAYLHGHHIVHRDIKPTQILIYLASDGSRPQIKLNIPSIAKMIRNEEIEEFTNTSKTNPVGTRGWMPPELYHSERLDFKVDIFPLGCVFAYALTYGGKHPFGDDPEMRIFRMRQKENMLLTIEDLRSPYCDDLSTFELIQSMLEMESFNRPSAEQVLNHVFFNIPNIVETEKAGETAASLLRKVDDYLSYDNNKVIGEGGFAYVFLGILKNHTTDPLNTRRKVNERDVAVKRFQKVPGKDTSVQKEVELMLKVKEHQNILHCFSTHSNEDFLFIVTELCNGTLKEWMEKKYQGPPIEDERNMLFQVTNGLAYLHANNIVHRDIKPSNILISIPVVEGDEPLIKLADFGISRILTKENGFTNTNRKAPLGTDGYMPPEMFKSKRYDFKVDIYSLGVVFGQLLSKQKKNPFEITRSEESITSMMTLKLEDIKQQYACDGQAIQLIKSMGSEKSEDRPTAQKVLANPFFHPMNCFMIKYGLPE